MSRRFILILWLLLGSANLHSQDIRLSIIGGDSTETKLIKSLKYKKTFSDLKSILIEIDSTQIKLQYRGYLENQIVKSAFLNDSAYEAEIHLKQKFDTIYIYYPKKYFSARNLKSLFKVVHDSIIKLPIEKVESGLRQLNSKLTDRGLPFASIRLVEIEKRTETNLQARMEVTTNKKRTLNGFVIKGYEKFPKSFIRHLLKIKSGDDFNLNEIKSKTERLRNLRFASQARSPEVLFTRDSTTLYLYLEKQKSNTFDGFLGFGTNEQTNKLEFDGYLNLNLINALNYGEEFQLNYKSDEIDQQTFNVRAQLPYLFGSPLGTDVSLNIFRKDSTFTSVNQNLDLFWPVNDRHKIFIGISAFQSNDLQDAAVQDIRDLDATFINLKYEWLAPRFDEPLFPMNFFWRSELGLGSRDMGNETEGQQRFRLETFKIFGLNDRNSIFARLTGGGLISETYFDNELMRFGGINSIRGVEENSLVASLFGVLNTEYRYRLNSGIYVHSIFDASYFENEITDQKEKIFGYGFGFGILTRAGLLKFNYANAKFEDQKFKFSNSKIHLSLIALF